LIHHRSCLDAERLPSHALRVPTESGDKSHALQNGQRRTVTNTATTGAKKFDHIGITKP